MSLKLYYVSDGPPSLAVMQALKYLEIPHKPVSVNYGAGEHMTEEYAQKNPQKEIPVLDDNGFYLSESNAILQYLCDKHRPDSSLYPKDPTVRAIVNHRLCFNLSTYYRYISEYTLAPIFFDYEKTALGLKKVHIALEAFETYLAKAGTKFAAADHITIADFPLVTATMCLQATDFVFSKYKTISTWYNDYKKEYPDLWSIAEAGMNELSDFSKNPPDLSHMDHPIHPVRKLNTKF